jgi:cell shape-determining protein MreC
MTGTKKQFFFRFLVLFFILTITFFIFEFGLKSISLLFQKIAILFSKPISSFSQALQAKAKLEKERQKLEKTVLLLEENLSECFLNNPYQSEKKQTRVIGFVLGSGGKKIFIDFGAKDGVRAGDWALTSQKSLVGRVETVNKNFSVVQTIFDPNLKVAAEIVSEEKIGPGGLFYFDGVEFVTDFLPNDLVLLENSFNFAQSSGKDGIFKSGFYLGKIIRVAASTEAQLKKAIIEPAFNLGDLKTVFLIENFF